MRVLDSTRRVLRPCTEDPRDVVRAGEVNVDDTQTLDARRPIDRTWCARDDAIKSSRCASRAGESKRRARTRAGVVARSG